MGDIHTRTWQSCRVNTACHWYDLENLGGSVPSRDYTPFHPFVHPQIASNVVKQMLTSHQKRACCVTGSSLEGSGFLKSRIICYLIPPRGYNCAGCPLAIAVTPVAKLLVRKVAAKDKMLRTLIKIEMISTQIRNAVHTV